MDIRIGQLTFTIPTTRATAAAGLPSSPPPEVLAEVDAAAGRADELTRSGRELHFELDEETGRVTIQLRDLAGNVIRIVSPSEALRLASDGEI
jgi:hypothetical protein